MRKLVSYAAVLFGLFAATSAQATLTIKNWDFESTPALTGWDTIGSPSPQVVNGVVSDGTYGNYVEMGNTEGISQNITEVVIGTSYIVDFWAQKQGDTPYIDVSLGTATVRVPTTGALPESWFHYQVPITASGTTLKFVATVNNGNSHADLDSVILSVATDPSAVPEPTTLIAGGLLLLPFGASVLRALRKDRKA
jgi:hypothetical protein